MIHKESALTATGVGKGGPCSPKRAGFTLIEVLLVIIITAVIAGIAATALRQGTDQYVDVASRGEVLNRSRYGLERMVREMRTALSGTITTWTAIAFEFDCQDPTNPALTITIRFELAGTDLERTRNAVTNDLLNGVTGLTFTYYDSSGNAPASVNQIKTIRIDLTVLADGETMTLVSTVYPRDL